MEVAPMRRKILAVLVVLGLVTAGLSIHSPPAREARAQASDSAIIAIANGWNIGSVASGAAVFGTDLKTHYASSLIRVYVVLGSSATLAVRETDGTNTFTTPLNAGTALTAGAAYGFTCEMRNSKAVNGGGVSPGPTSFNFVIQGGASTVPILRVTELPGGAD